MPSVAYVGEVLSDGHLSLPELILQQLGLRAGQKVEVVARPCEDDDWPPPEAYEPLRELIGLVRDGPPDGSVNHDRYLYGEDTGRGSSSTRVRGWAFSWRRIVTTRWPFCTTRSWPPNGPGC